MHALFHLERYSIKKKQNTSMKLFKNTVRIPREIPEETPELILAKKSLRKTSRYQVTNILYNSVNTRTDGVHLSGVLQKLVVWKLCTDE